MFDSNTFNYNKEANNKIKSKILKRDKISFSKILDL